MTTQPRWRSSVHLDQIAVTDHWRVCCIHPPNRRPRWTCPICGEERFSVVECWGSKQHLWEKHGVPGKFEFNGKPIFYGPQDWRGSVIRFWKLAPRWKIIRAELIVWLLLATSVNAAPWSEDLRAGICVIVFWIFVCLIRRTSELPRFKKQPPSPEFLYGPKGR